jgi:hypothetical protein
MTDRKEPDRLFDQLCAVIRTTKNVLKYHYNVTDEEIDSITSLVENYK